VCLSWFNRSARLKTHLKVNQGEGDVPTLFNDRVYVFSCLYLLKLVRATNCTELIPRVIMVTTVANDFNVTVNFKYRLFLPSFTFSRPLGSKAYNLNKIIIILQS